MSGPTQVMNQAPPSSDIAAQSMADSHSGHTRSQKIAQHLGIEAANQYEQLEIALKHQGAQRLKFVNDAILRMKQNAEQLIDSEDPEKMKEGMKILQDALNMYGVRVDKKWYEHVIGALFSQRPAGALVGVMIKLLLAAITEYRVNRAAEKLRAMTPPNGPGSTLDESKLSDAGIEVQTDPDTGEQSFRDANNPAGGFVTREAFVQNQEDEVAAGTATRDALLEEVNTKLQEQGVEPFTPEELRQALRVAQAQQATGAEPQVDIDNYEPGDVDQFVSDVVANPDLYRTIYTQGPDASASSVAIVGGWPPGIPAAGDDASSNPIAGAGSGIGADPSALPPAGPPEAVKRPRSDSGSSTLSL